MLLKFLGLFLLSTPSDGANILCFAPMVSLSHQLLPRMLMRSLAERGHNVTLFTTDPFDSDLPNLVQHSWHYTHELFKNMLNYARKGERDKSIFATTWQLRRDFVAAVKLQLEHPAIGELLNGGQTFDVVVVEALGASPFYAFARHFNVPLIGYTTYDAVPFSHLAVGNFIHPVVNTNPTILGAEDLSFLQRLFVVFSEVYLAFMYIPFARQQDEYIEQYFGPDMAKTVELVTDLDFLIFNNHPVFGTIRPTSPAALAVGFMHIEPTKPLSEDLEVFFAERKVIFFSLGSNVRSADLSQKTLVTFCAVFRKLPYNVLWKWEGPELPFKPDNVKTVKWLPQQDVLAHKNTQLFITQGGQQSIEEAIYHAVPMLVIPFANDQFRNAHIVERLGVGQQLDFESLSPESLGAAINNLLTNSTFKASAIKVSQLAKDQPMTSLKSAVWWTEYVIRHKGAKHLHPMSKRVPFYQFFMLDILAAVVVVVCAGYVMLRRCISWLKSIIWPRFNYVKLRILKLHKIA